MARFFTLRQAQILLPEVDVAIREAIFLKSEFERAEAELQAAMERIRMMGGTLVNRDRLTGQKSHREQSAVKFKDAVEKIHSYGCLIKDLDIGLIDFPTLYRGEEVYLCWRLGEQSIEHWHGVSEGFHGRKKIDQEFLDNHNGDLSN